MTDEELRRLVREAVARHLGRAGAVPAARATTVVLSERTVWPLSPAPQSTTLSDSTGATHPSHHQYIFLSNVTTACVIEPAVACDHCGYCKSHGH